MCASLSTLHTLGHSFVMNLIISLLHILMWSMCATDDVTTSVGRLI